MTTEEHRDFAYWQAKLRAAGLRATTGRVEALRSLAHLRHATTAELHAAVAKSMGSVSVQSMHNIMHDLTEHDLVYKVDLPYSSGAVYEIFENDNHHHVQCVVCHRLEDIDCVIGEAPCVTPSHTHGMRLLQAAITFRGVCQSCESRIGEEQTASQAPLPSATATT